MNFKNLVIVCFLITPIYVFGFSGNIPSLSCTTNDGYLAAFNEEYFDMATGFLVDKDYVALQKLMDANLVFIMKKGVKVYLVETHMFQGKVEIRLPGETQIIWTNSEAINCR